MGFLWKGQDQADGGKCLDYWPRVSRLIECGGLGIHDLPTLGWSLQLQ